MPLVIGGVPVEEAPPDTRSLFLGASNLKDAAAQLTANPSKMVGPHGLLYVWQREFAATLSQDKNVSILGSDDCTTCLIVILRHTGSGAISLAHMDGADVDGGVSLLISRMLELSNGYEGRLELSMVGGFSDPRAHSERLSISVLHAFHRQQIEIDLVLACIGDLNTTYRGGMPWPFIYGVGVYVKTGEIFPAVFHDKGTDMPLRTARIFTNGQQQLMDIYDCSLGLMRIGPFSYPPVRGVDLWLQQSDELIISHLSPAPEVEPPNFAQRIRSALNFIRKHQFPSITVFPDGRPKFYRREHGGMWLEIQY